MARIRTSRWLGAAAVAGLSIFSLRALSAVLTNAGWRVGDALAARAELQNGGEAARVLLAQDEGGGDEGEVSPAEIDKYVAVYRAMHRDHALTVEQAAAQQGMSVAAFRALENRVERDSAAMERARDELQQSAVHASPGASATH